MSPLHSLQFSGSGVPTDQRYSDEVRNRAHKLVQKNPDFYRMDPDDSILWCNTVDSALFQIIYDWVLDNKGSEPQ